MTRDRLLWVGGVAAVAILLAGVIAFVITRGEDDDGASGAATTTAVPRSTEPVPACEVLTADDIADVMGATYTAAEDATDLACSYSDGQQSTVTVVLAAVPTPAAFRMLAQGPGAGAEVQDVADVGSEAVSWSSSRPPGATLVLRVGGQAVTITLIAPTPAEPGESADPTDATDPSEITETTEPEPVGPTAPAPDPVVLAQDRVVQLGTVAAARLPEVPFADGPDVDRAVTTCAALSVEALAPAVLIPVEGSVLQPLGDTGCTLSSTTGVNISVEVAEGPATAEDLEVRRSSTVDGEETEWPVEVVDGLGDGARWLAEPSGASGELLVLYGDRLVRVTSSGPKSGPELRSRAEQMATVAGPIVAG